MGKEALNLDELAASAGRKIVDPFISAENRDKVEGLIRKALGIVQENGVYAAALFLFTRGKDERSAAEACWGEMLRIAGTLSPAPLTSPPPAGEKQKCLYWLSDVVCSDMHRLFLVKQCWEQTLIYARYNAQAVLTPIEKKK